MLERIKQRLATTGMAVSEEEAESLRVFLQLLLKWNAVHNLTAITEPDAMIKRHLVESLSLRPFLRGVRIADVGSGAGLPGIPLAIVDPDREFTLIESRAKRARFLSHVKGALDLSNVTVEHGRVEDLRGMAPFDTVLARAVAALPELLGLTEHLLGKDSVLLVLTKADIGPEASAVDKRYTVRRLDSGVSHLLDGALVAIERAAH